MNIAKISMEFERRHRNGQTEKEAGDCGILANSISLKAWEQSKRKNEERREIAKKKGGGVFLAVLASTNPYTGLLPV
jgi:hypothetical protein